MISEIISFFLGVFVAIFAEPIRQYLFNTAKIKIYFNERNIKHKRAFQGGNIDYRIEVKNQPAKFNTKTTAKSCLIKITLKSVDGDIIIKNSAQPYITSKSDFAGIEDEYILWDFQYGGENPYTLDIPPQSGATATFARYKKGPNFWEIPSENIEKPRVYLENKSLTFEITVYGDNFKPRTETIKIKKP